MHTRNTILLLLLFYAFEVFNLFLFDIYMGFPVLYIGPIASFRNFVRSKMHLSFRNWNKDERWLYLIWFAFVYCIKTKFIPKSMQTKQDSKKQRKNLQSTAYAYTRTIRNLLLFLSLFGTSFLVLLIFFYPLLKYMYVYLLLLRNVHRSSLIFQNWRWLNARIPQGRTFQWCEHCTHWKWTNGTHNSKQDFLSSDMKYEKMKSAHSKPNV